MKHAIYLQSTKPQLIFELVFRIRSLLYFIIKAHKRRESENRR